MYDSWSRPVTDSYQKGYTMPETVPLTLTAILGVISVLATTGSVYAFIAYERPVYAALATANFMLFLMGLINLLR